MVFRAWRQNYVYIPVIFGPNIPNPYLFSMPVHPFHMYHPANSSQKSRVLHRYYVIPRNTCRGNQLGFYSKSVSTKILKLTEFGKLQEMFVIASNVFENKFENDVRSPFSDVRDTNENFWRTFVWGLVSIISQHSSTLSYIF